MVKIKYLIIGVIGFTSLVTQASAIDCGDIALKRVASVLKGTPKQLG